MFYYTNDLEYTIELGFQHTKSNILYANFNSFTVLV